ncbi:MAG: AraC family transcriptional regulator [Bacteroidales bacterium]|nr:AraC family transcriptional regulator [Bacteroidales bacterium]
MHSEIANKYVPYSKSDEDWGLFILDVGKMKTPENSEYPVGPHPPDYIFSYSKGRVLQEYQVLYINEGWGEFESEISGRISIEPGAVIILHPGVWHRYRPSQKTGWRESWVGFNGRIAKHIMETDEFCCDNPVVKIGIHSRINTIYDQLLIECNQAEPGFQQVAAGLVMELLGLIKMYRQTRMFNNREVQSKISQSKKYIEEKHREQLEPKDIADEAGMGYSNFRKHFRLLTGFSPVQYIIHLRLRSAKELLYNTDLTVKEIASRTGFSSSYYFIRLFREKIGMTPRVFRLKVRGDG